MPQLKTRPIATPSMAAGPLYNINPQRQAQPISITIPTLPIMPSSDSPLSSSSLSRQHTEPGVPFYSQRSLPPSDDVPSQIRSVSASTSAGLRLRAKTALGHYPSIDRSDGLHHHQMADGPQLSHSRSHSNLTDAMTIAKAKRLHEQYHHHHHHHHHLRHQLATDAEPAKIIPGTSSNLPFHSGPAEIVRGNAYMGVPPVPALSHSASNSSLSSTGSDGPASPSDTEEESPSQPVVPTDDTRVPIRPGHLRTRSSSLAHSHSYSHLRSALPIVTQAGVKDVHTHQRHRVHPSGHSQHPLQREIVPQNEKDDNSVEQNATSTPDDSRTSSDVSSASQSNSSITPGSNESQSPLHKLSSSPHLALKTQSHEASGSASKHYASDLHHPNDGSSPLSTTASSALERQENIQTASVAGQPTSTVTPNSSTSKSESPSKPPSKKLNASHSSPSKRSHKHTLQRSKIIYYPTGQRKGTSVPLSFTGRWDEEGEPEFVDDYWEGHPKGVPSLSGHGRSISLGSGEADARVSVDVSIQITSDQTRVASGSGVGFSEHRRSMSAPSVLLFSSNSSEKTLENSLVAPDDIPSTPANVTVLQDVLNQHQQDLEDGNLKSATSSFVFPPSPTRGTKKAMRAKRTLTVFESFSFPMPPSPPTTGGNKPQRSPSLHRATASESMVPSPLRQDQETFDEEGEDELSDLPYIQGSVFSPLKTPGSGISWVATPKSTRTVTPRDYCRPLPSTPLISPSSSSTSATTKYPFSNIPRRYESIIVAQKMAKGVSGGVREARIAQEDEGYDYDVPPRSARAVDVGINPWRLGHSEIPMSAEEGGIGSLIGMVDALIVA